MRGGGTLSVSLSVDSRHVDHWLLVALEGSDERRRVLVLDVVAAVLPQEVGHLLHEVAVEQLDADADEEEEADQEGDADLRFF